MTNIALPHHIIKEIVAHAESQNEHEVCGLVSRNPDNRFHRYPVKNVANNSHCRFIMDPQEQIEAMRTIRENNESLFAIYHSHPDGPALPSLTDLMEAAYPDALNLIVSLSQQPPEVRGFFIQDQHFAEVKLISQ